jgi:hypothetical protein
MIFFFIYYCVLLSALWLLYYASEEGEAVITGDKE